jgi:hypothetical protein
LLCERACGFLLAALVFCCFALLFGAALALLLRLFALRLTLLQGKERCSTR